MRRLQSEPFYFILCEQKTHRKQSGQGLQLHVTF